MENSKKDRAVESDGAPLSDSGLLQEFLLAEGGLKFLARKRLPKRYRRGLEPEDLVQEAFVSLYKSHRSGVGVVAVRPFLASAVWRIADRARRREVLAAKNEGALKQLALVFEGSTPEEIVAVEQRLARLHRVVDQMRIPVPAIDLFLQDRVLGPDIVTIERLRVAHLTRAVREAARKIRKAEEERPVTPLTDHSERAREMVSEQFGTDEKWALINDLVWRAIATRAGHTITLSDVDRIAEVVSANDDEVLAVVTLLSQPGSLLLRFDFVDLSGPIARSLSRLELATRVRSWWKDKTMPESAWHSWASNVRVQWSAVLEQAA